MTRVVELAVRPFEAHIGCQERGILEVIMKYLVPALGIAALMLAVSPVSAANRCLEIRDIKSSESKDGRTMVFKMKDGTTLVNHLQGYCTDLKYTGFAWQ